MSISHNLNYLKNIFRHPCATPDIEIIIETAFEAFVPALMQVIGIGCTDIIKMRAGKSPWHTRAMNGFIKGVNIPEAVGKNIYRYSVPYAAVEAGLWWWMVIDAGFSFFPHWASLMYQESKCDLPRNGFVESTIAIGPKFAVGTYRCLLGSPDTKPAIRIIGDECIISAGCSGTVTYHVTLEQFFPIIYGAGQAEVWIEDQTGQISTVSTWDGATDPTENKVAGGINKARGSALAELHMWVNIRVLRGVVGIPEGHIRASGYGLPIPLVSGGCTPRPVTYPWQ